MYLGRRFAKDGKIQGKIEKKVHAGRRILGIMSSIGKREDLSMDAKKPIYKSVLH